MNQKRSHSRRTDPSKSTELPTSDRLEQLLSSHDQVNPLHQFWRVWWRHSTWGNFNRGLFWGGLVSLISILSAMGGVALTNVDLVKQQISQRLPGNSNDAVESSKQAALKDSTLTTPLQILLVEVEFDPDALVGFSATARGKSKTILLLKVKPELNQAQVINIPLDSKASIPGFGQGTVKDAYRLGGMDLLSQTINQLPGNLRVDRYFRTTPEVFKQLTDSGKITLEGCDSRIRDCNDKSEQIFRQLEAFETIRQRFNIPNYLTSFETAIAKAKPQIDTNISVPEIISVANFIKELEPDYLTVDLLPGYTPGKAIKNIPNQGRGKSAIDQGTSLSSSTFDSRAVSDRNYAFQGNSVAVQNTTDNPELGRRVVAYLRQRNFRDVYLVEHIPLRLEQTKIMANHGQVEMANYLKNVLEFGNLEAKSAQEQPTLVLQLGKDADAIELAPSD
jgi:polyisoprenyl-teichoic acid--peptidoglycan teichoic acid transferase